MKNDKRKIKERSMQRNRNEMQIAGGKIKEKRKVRSIANKIKKMSM